MSDQQKQSEETKIAVIASAMGRMESDIKDIKADVKEALIRVDDTFVSKVEFTSFKEQMELIKRIVYGTVSLILTGVLAGILSIVIRK